jgi:hypothetical protein
MKSWSDLFARVKPIICAFDSVQFALFNMKPDHAVIAARITKNKHGDEALAAVLKAIDDKNGIMGVCDILKPTTAMLTYISICVLLSDACYRSTKSDTYRLRAVVCNACYTSISPMICNVCVNTGFIVQSVAADCVYKIPRSLVRVV